MKKYFLLAAMVGVALTGCVSNEPDLSGGGEERPISFAAPVVTSNTRAVSEVGTTYNTNLDFLVWAQYHADNATFAYNENDLLIKGETAYYQAPSGDTDKGTWIPMHNIANAGETANNVPYYWPKNGSLTFIACSPANKLNTASTVSYDASGITITDFEVSTTASQQYDLLISERACMKTESDATPTDADTYKGVDLTFLHALSSIYFSAKLTGTPTLSGETTPSETYPGTTIKLTSINLNNIVSKATFNQNLNSNPVVKDQLTKTPKAASDNTATNLATNEASWAAATTTEGTETKNVTSNYSVDVATGGVELKTAAYYPATSSTTAPTGTGERNTDLILIPQSLKGANIVITYTMQQGDGPVITQTHTMEFTDTDSWKMGYRYLYNISISLDPITLAPTVSVYEDAVQAGTGIEVN